ncbi:calmodulin [Mytilus galloprovincialis]|uniref:Calmodulin n=1 Tax=Mytilus galloprovincialis TaxID=29158 RepID=A0A8B6CH48_MYTGA|nr:calmodulin [Mytilus galloprovincialis]
MGKLRTIFVAVIAVSIAIVLGNPGTTIADSQEARRLFRLADKNHDFQLNPKEMHSVFLDFDLNNDTYIYVDEFINDWLSDNLGTALEAVTLFHHLDVDNSGYISENPDMPYIIHFFDRDLDGHISQAEFVIQWVKIKNS